MADEDLSKLKIDKGAAVRRPALRKRLFWWLSLAIVVIIAAYLIFTGKLTPAVQVDVATVSDVYPYQAYSLLNASGYVVAQRKAAVAAKTTSSLEWLGVEEGSRVKKGQVIARLESKDVSAARLQAAANLKVSEANLNQAQAELRDSKLAYDREKELVKEGVVAQADFDSADARHRKAIAGVAGGKSSVRAAREALRAAEAAVEYTLIRAPFDAVVLTKNADVGDIITPLGAAANAKASVVTIADLGSLQVEADVSESNLEKIRMGQPCEISLDAFPEDRFRGEVHMIVPTADRSKATVLVKVRFVDMDKRILPEMSAMVTFLSRTVPGADRKPKTAVSPSAFATRQGRKVVFTVKGDRVSEAPVQTGAVIGEYIEIRSGVKAGDKVVLKPPENLRDGSKIKTAEK